MANAILRLPDDTVNTGKKVDLEQVVVGVDTVIRERIELAGSTASAIADVVNTQLVGTEYAVPVRAIIDVDNVPNIAHGTTDSGGPNKIGMRAKTGVSGVTLVTVDQRTDLFAGVDGVMFNRPHAPLEDLVDGNASNTDGHATQVVAAAGAGIKQYLTGVLRTNTSATNGYVEMKSGTTVKATIPVPANSGAIVNFATPLRPNAANEAWNFDPSTAMSTIFCTATGFKSKI